jgi:hypothetical protein
MQGSFCQGFYLTERAYIAKIPVHREFFGGTGFRTLGVHNIYCSLY